MAISLAVKASTESTRTSHERWRHPLIGKTLTIPGKDGDDVPLYLEKQLTKLLTELKELREDGD